MRYTCFVFLLITCGCHTAVVTTSADLPLGAAVRLTARTAGGQIFVVPGGSNAIHIDITRTASTASEASSLQVTTTVQGDEALVAWDGPTDDDSVSFAIAAPPSLGLSATTLGGGLQVDGFQAGMTLSSKGGNIDVKDASGALSGTTEGGSISVAGLLGDAMLHSGGGGIDVTGAKGSVIASTGGGDISIREQTGSIDAQTSGGSVTIEGVLSGTNRAQTSGGNVNATIPTASNLGITAQTDAGSAGNDFGFAIVGFGPSVGFSGTLGAGDGGSLKLQSNGGSIYLHRLD